MRKIFFAALGAALFSCSKEEISKTVEKERHLTVEFNTRSQYDFSTTNIDVYCQLKFIVKRPQPPNNEVILWDTLIPRIRVNDMLPIKFTAKVSNLYWGSGQITAVQQCTYLRPDGSPSPFTDESKLPVKNTDSLQVLQFVW